jgi:hypothetical protein
MNQAIYSRPSFLSTVSNSLAVPELKPLGGFQSVISIMQMAEEGVFTFERNKNLCLYFSCKDCTGLTFTCTAHKKVKGSWVKDGRHTFNQQGISKTITVNWDDLVICE